MNTYSTTGHNTGWKRGSILLMSLVMIGVMVIMLSAAIAFVNRQTHETINQEQEEKAFHVAEAGVYYTLFLLNSNTYTMQGLTALADPLEKIIPDPVTQQTIGTVTLSFAQAAGYQAGERLMVTAIGRDVADRTCQRIDAAITVGSGSTPYTIGSWDHPRSCSGSLIPVSPTPTPVPSLIGYWKFDETTVGEAAIDSSGNGYNGTPQGSQGSNNGPQPSTDVPTLAFSNGRSRHFDATDDYFNVGDIDVDYVTMSAWVKADATTNGFILSKNYDGNSVPFSLNIGGTTAPELLDGLGYFTAYVIGWRNSGIATDFRGDGLWHHVAGTYDGSTLKYYVDGNLDSSSSEGTGGALPQNNLEVEIGRYGDSTNAFGGLIDDVRLYNRALSATEIADLAAGLDVQ